MAIRAKASKLSGHALGRKPIGADRPLTFSGFRYTEMTLDVEPLPDAITLDSGELSSCARKATGTDPASLRYRQPGRSMIRGKMLYGSRTL